MASNRPHLRLVLVEDQHIVAEGLKRILSEARGFQIVAEARAPVTAIAVVERTRPQLVVMDMRLAGGTGGDATRGIKQLPDSPPVLAIGDEESLHLALCAGADGFALEASDGRDLVLAVRAVADGGTWLDPAVAWRVVETFRSVQTEAPCEDGIAELTPREREVFESMASGRTNAEISSMLYVGEGTVKTHVSHILTKLGLRDRVQAVIAAYELGVVVPAGRNRVGFDASPTRQDIEETRSRVSLVGLRQSG